MRVPLAHAHDEPTLFQPACVTDCKRFMSPSLSLLLISFLFSLPIPRFTAYAVTPGRGAPPKMRREASRHSTLCSRVDCHLGDAFDEVDQTRQISRQLIETKAEGEANQQYKLRELE